MYITINLKKEYTNDFLRWLINRMFIIGLSYANEHKEKLIPIDKYLKTIFTGKRTYTAMELIIAGLKNYTLSNNKFQSIISINPRAKVPRNDQILLSTMCQLINYGNLQINPFPIFTYVCNYVSNNLSELYNQYELGIFI